VQRELDRPLAEAEESPPIVAWRARQVLPVVLAAGVALVGLSLVASRAGSNSVDLGATLWLQSFQQPAFAALMAAVSWPGFFPQNWIVPVLLAVALASLRFGSWAPRRRPWPRRSSKTWSIGNAPRPSWSGSLRR